MDGERASAGAGEAIFRVFFDTLGATGPVGQQLADELRTLRDIGELTREQTLVETFERLTRDPR